MPSNPDDLDRVQLLKQESVALGGDAADDNPEWQNQPIEPQEDAIEVAGRFVQNETYRDENVAVWRDGNTLRAKDPVYGAVDLLASGSGGISAEAHKILRQLIHFIDDGPAEGFVSGAYKETLPTGSPFPTSEIWWESSSKLKKIVELTTTWTGAVITAEEWKMYDTDGTTVLATVTDAITYSGVFESNRTRTIVVT